MLPSISYIRTKFPPSFLSLVFCSRPLSSLPLFYFSQTHPPQPPPPPPPPDLTISPTTRPTTSSTVPPISIPFPFSFNSLPILPIPPFLSHPLPPPKKKPSKPTIGSGRWMSGSRPPNLPVQPLEPIMQQPPKRQLPFSSMKPPFSAAADYHGFLPDPRQSTDQETYGITVKPPVSCCLFIYL